MFAAALIAASASELRGVMRGRFLLGSDILKGSIGVATEYPWFFAVVVTE